MKKNRYIMLIFFTIVLPIFLWSLSFPNTSITHNSFQFYIYGSQLFAVIGFSLLAFTFILSVKNKTIEKFFGGLDKQYHLHHTIGKIAFLGLCIHPILLALRWLPDNMEKTFSYLLPLHRKIEINLGAWSLLGLVTLLLLTIVIKLPYDKWRITHKFMGLFFLLGIIHVFGVNDFFEDNLYLAIYFIIISVLGLLAFLHKSIFHNWIVKKHQFKVEKIDRLNNTVMEISLTPSSHDFEYVPGQFCFFQFIAKGISTESHPYTICGNSEKDKISVLVKSLGDYTIKLHQQLTLNTKVMVEGPYGSFDYRLGNKKQIWIAGGVGIAPYLSWIRSFDRKSRPNLEIDFYYCVKDKAEAYHLLEFEELEQTMPKFSINLFCSSTTGHIKGSDFSDLRDKTIFICGPKGLRQALLKDFKQLNLPKNQIIYEDFDFL